jgi:hypothetical protein
VTPPPCVRVIPLADITRRNTSNTMQHHENSESQHSGDLVEQLRRYAFAGVPLAGQHTAFYERHLKIAIQRNRLPSWLPLF